MKSFVRIFVSLVLCLLCASSAALASDYASIDFTDKQAAAANLFLSNFTEVGVRSISSYPDDMELVDFAHDHLWFNSHDSFQYGEYFNDNNCRVSDDRILSIVDKYFYDVPWEIDLSQTRFDYDGEYYYHCETGGWMNDGFAHVVSICPIGDDKYFVAFYVFGGGNYWENAVMSMSLSEIVAEHGAPCGYGSAIIYADDLADRSTYKMISFSRH